MSTNEILRLAIAIVIGYVAGTTISHYRELAHPSEAIVRLDGDKEIRCSCVDCDESYPELVIKGRSVK